MKLVLFVVLFVFTPPPSRNAECVCIKDPHPSEDKVRDDRRLAYDRATEVFEGKVVALDSYKVTLKLQKRWKGLSEDEVNLSTGAVSGYDGTPLPKECSFQFQLGQEYLVYAYGAPNEMEASSCLTLGIKDAAAEENGLDQIKVHKTIRAKIESHEGQTLSNTVDEAVQRLVNQSLSSRPQQMRRLKASF